MMISFAVFYARRRKRLAVHRSPLAEALSSRPTANGQLLNFAPPWPLIAGALTTLECSVYDQLPGGDHTIFVGEVVSIRTSEGSPLIYFRSGYGEMQI